MLKLVVNNSVKIKEFDNFEEAADYLVTKINAVENMIRKLSGNQINAYINGLYDKHIECFESDTGNAVYKVRIVS